MSDHGLPMDFAYDNYGADIDELHVELTKVRGENGLIFRELNSLGERVDKLTLIADSEAIGELKNEIGGIRGDVERILSILSLSSGSAVNAADARLEARVAALEAAARTTASGSLAAKANQAAGRSAPVSASVAAAAAGPTSVPASAPASAPAPTTGATAPTASAAPTATAAAPALSTDQATATPPSSTKPVPPAAGSWVDVVKKKKGKAPITVEALKASSDPLGVLLVKPPEAVTTEIMVTHLTLPLSIEAQQRPHLAWRTAMKAITGDTPLQIVLVHCRRAIVYWDVSDIRKKAPILRALDGRGSLKFPVEADEVKDHVYLRAYLGGFFKLLRLAALKGLSQASRTWILDKAEERWRLSKDKIRRNMWLRRISQDRDALNSGEKVAEGLSPSLDFSRPDPKPGQASSVPCITGDQWIADAVYLIREQAEVRAREGAAAARREKG